MSSCSVQILDQVPASQFERTCPTCKLKIANQFVSKCPRCLTKLSLAGLCVGCYQNSNCHGTELSEIKLNELIQIALPKEAK